MGANFSFVGPGGDTGSYFTPLNSLISGTIPLGVYGAYQNPEMCFKYKALLDTTNFDQTPALNDVTVNYSP